MRSGSYTRISDCILIEFPTFPEVRGNLTVIETARQVPFEIKRLFYVYDVPPAEPRGAHAHKRIEHVLICLAGSFEVRLDDGTEQRVVGLNQPRVGLYIPPMIWDTESNFAPGTVCLVLASDYYDESDYLRDYAEFLRTKLQSR